MMPAHIDLQHADSLAAMSRDRWLKISQRFQARGYRAQRVWACGETLRSGCSVHVVRGASARVFHSTPDLMLYLCQVEASRV